MKATDAQSTVLIVEDDEAIALLERRALERRGFRVLEASSSEEAIAAARMGPIDLAVMDYRLPDSTTGLELMKKLSALGYDLPVIMVTGFSNESTAIEALRQGVRDFIPKTAEYLEYLPEAAERVIKTVRTERELAESEEALRVRDEQLRQSQKMEAVGQLAGGVAHDFNNLLTIILGYSDVLSETPDASPDQRREMLSEIHQAAEKAAHLTRQLLAFSRKQVLEPKVMNLNDAVASIEKMLRRLIGEDITIHTDLASDLRQVSADPGQIEQVIMNLVVNARDAMPNGGDISIKTENVELDERYAATHADVKPGSYVMLAISDTGSGMDEATRQRIFEPFFTTKGVGKGTGLGLATVYGIVKQSGGHIWVYSELGQGTVFKLYFPTVDAPTEAAPSRASQQRALRGNETILLVEDEQGVRALAKNVLEMYGYRVLEAKDPLEAIQVSRSHKEAIDLLLTDVVMPQMNGKRLSEVLVPERPNMKVLFMSGYTDDTVTRQRILEPGACFLQKPFTPTALAAKLRSALQKA